MLNSPRADAFMQCTLLIPDLWWPGAASDEVYRDLAVPELQTLLARARRRSLPAISVEGWLCQAFEVARQTDWPVAPLTLTVDGGDPGVAYWLRADPVHLRPHRDHLLLADSSAFTIAQNEADELVAALNTHFAAEGMCFLALRPDRWYLRLESDPEIATHPLGEVVGVDVNPYLPTGRNALSWHRICNEAQMLFHDHPVNGAREARGEPAINSVWLWGGGRKPAVPGRRFSAVWSDDTLALALAARAGVPAAPVAAAGSRWLQLPRETSDSDDHYLLVLAQLAPGARRGDFSVWRDELAAINRRWLAPLLAALKRRLLHRLTLVAPGRTSCERFELTPWELFKFWRTTRPVADYAPASPR